MRSKQTARRRRAEDGGVARAAQEPKGSTAPQTVASQKPARGQCDPEMFDLGPSDEPVTLERSLKVLQTLADKPESFVAPPASLGNALTRLLVGLFAYARAQEPIKLGPLDELVVDGFDTETLWEELMLRNPAVQRFVTTVTDRLAEQGDALQVFKHEPKEDEHEDGDGGSTEDGESYQDYEEELVDGDVGDDDDEEDDEFSQRRGEDGGSPGKRLKVAGRKGSRKGGRRKQTDEEEDPEPGGDRFFSIEEMERFADEAERKEMDGLMEQDDEDGDDEDEDEDEDGDMDGLDGGDDEGDGRELRYDDLWGDEGGDDGEEGDADEDGEMEEDEASALPRSGGRKRKLLQADPQDEEEEGEDDQHLTVYQREERARLREMKELEDQLVAERPWELRGEVHARDRPENSLLEAVVDVERAARPALLMTAEKAASIEDMIKKRILEEKWDDVVPKDVGDEIMMNKRKKDDLPEVSQEKSREGLGEVYEKEYMRLAMGVEGESQEAKDKAEMSALFRKICTKLDALSNFYFTPKPAAVELKVTSNVPAIAMEEVLPLAVSNAETQAPEEVLEKKKGREGVLRDDAELEREERQRLRSSKKAARKKARRAKENEEKLVERLNPGLGNRYSREKLKQQLRDSGKVVKGKQVQGSGEEYTSSNVFFKNLQEEVSKHGGGYAKEAHSKEAQAEEAKARRSSAFKL